MVDIPGNSTTTRTITVGGTTSDTLEVVGDHDWFRITLTAGQSISVALDGIALEDPYLRIYDASGNLLYENDDTNPGIDRDSLLAFTATYSGTYYIDVGAWDENYTGTYQLSVDTYTPPPLATADEIADQMTSGAWGGDEHHFNVTQGGTITVNLTALTPAGQTLARAALATWTDIIGVNFVEVSSGGQIAFDDNEEGAFSSSNWSNGIISSSHVNVSTQWLQDYGTGLNSYSFQTYIHEIGHALGLGHAGNYNGTARYPFDALFQNDSWAMSVMSYFSQTENTYFAGQGFDENFLVTPMLADILAMSALYGLSTTTRLGDTIYELSNTLTAQCIFDSGGNDTIDASGSGSNQLINLNPGTFSNIWGEVGNVSIAFGVVIENAMGGGGSDELIGNDADNLLIGYGGDDELYGNAGNDQFRGGDGDDLFDGGAGTDRVLYDDVLAGITVNLSTGLAMSVPGSLWTIGTDQLVGIENVTASNFADTITGSSATNSLFGGAGNDTLNGAAGNDTLDGGTGADQLAGGTGDDIFIVDQADDVVTEAAGEGTDEVRSALAYTLGANVENFRLTGLAAVAGTGNTLDNALRGNEAANALSGLAGADKLYGNGGDDALDGGTGDDYLYGGLGNDTLTGGTGYDRMYGGAGNDTYYANDADDYAYENAGEGHDTVISSIDHQLRAEVEDLLLTGSALIGKGNAGNNGITGTLGANKLYGYEGNDTLLGMAGDDYLLGAEGNDTLNGGAGYDRMYGGTGDDRYYVNDTTDYAYENAGEGTDRVVSSINHTLRANVEELELAGSSDLRGYGNAENNLLLGNDGNNLLYGRDGNDSLIGNGGNDILYGENGNDQLTGGSGLDRFYGGTGQDDFIFNDGDFAGMSSGTADRIHDFGQAEGDIIDLGGVDANTGLAGDQAFAFIGTGAFTGTAGELRTQQISGNTYVQGDLNGDGTADFWIRLDGLHTLGSSDFVM